MEKKGRMMRQDESVCLHVYQRVNWEGGEGEREGEGMRGSEARAGIPFVSEESGDGIALRACCCEETR